MIIIKLFIMDNLSNLDIEIYGFSGKMGVGKNFIGENIFNKAINKLNHKNTLILAFADHLKIDMCIKHNFEYEDLYYNKNDSTRIEMQKYGTELGRNVYGIDVWVKAMTYWIQTFYDRGIRRFIITDVRFENEMQLIKNFGGVNILIKSDNYNSATINTSYHSSENSINQDLVNYTIINNHSTDIYNEVDTLIKNIYTHNYNSATIKN